MSTFSGGWSVFLAIADVDFWFHSLPTYLVSSFSTGSYLSKLRLDTATDHLLYQSSTPS